MYSVHVTTCNYMYVPSISPYFPFVGSRYTMRVHVHVCIIIYMYMYTVPAYQWLIEVFAQFFVNIHNPIVESLSNEFLKGLCQL